MFPLVYSMNLVELSCMNFTFNVASFSDSPIFLEKMTHTFWHFLKSPSNVATIVRMLDCDLVVILCIWKLLKWFFSYVQLFATMFWMRDPTLELVEFNPTIEFACFTWTKLRRVLVWTLCLSVQYFCVFMPIFVMHGWS